MHPRARTKTRIALLVAAVATVTAGAAVTAAGNSAPSAVPTVTGDARVDRLIAQMTLKEKFTLLSGQAEAASPDKQFQAGYLAGIPRLGIPSLKLTDGPPGVITKQDSTGMPATMAVASTFDAATAKANGAVIGADGRALGQDVMLEPFINIDRDTTFSRGFNTFGEDPLLTSAMGAATITGIQSQGVMAQAKHFIAYDGGNNVEVDQQTLHEIYLAPFAAAVNAGVSSIMCSYNVINGEQACGNSSTLTGILRNELGFTGFVTSDWGANHSTTYLNQGLDMEMPGGGGPTGTGIPSYFDINSLTQAVHNGTIQVARVDQAVGRILTQYDKFGLLTGHSKHTVTPLPTAADEKVVQQTAEKSATLLKNTANTLPLSSAALSSLALIGPGAGQLIATDGGGEKSGGLVAQQTSPLAALKQAAPGAHVTYSVADDMTGTPVPASALSHDGKPGLVRTTGTTTQVDETLNFTHSNHAALPAGQSTSWAGTLTVPTSGTYWLNAQTLGATLNLTVDGKSLITTGSGFSPAPRYGNVHITDGNGPLPTTDDLANGRVSVALTAGPHSISLASAPDVSGRPVEARLNWVTPEQQVANTNAAVAAAGRAKLAVVFAWADGATDLSKPLAEGQDALISAVAAANPNTVVVLNSSQPIAMPWLSKVKSVLEMWYPGDKGGPATANVLLGKVNPGGHLPFTWPASLDQELAHQSAHPERTSNGVNPSTGQACGPPARNDTTCVTTYSEGVDVGYRYYLATGERPLYPFGYGLSYTSFRYSGLQVSTASDGGVNVSFQLTNKGTAAGSAVPQVYLGAPDTPVSGASFAPKALAGFDRVNLAAGQTTTVSVHVPVRSLQYWSTIGGWTVATGGRQLIVGPDATTTSLQRHITVRNDSSNHTTVTAD